MVASTEGSWTNTERWLPEGSVAALGVLGCLSLPPRESG